MSSLLRRIEILQDALEFYANRDNYWGTPLSLDAHYCLRTLRAKTESSKSNKVLQDFGDKAKKALEKAGVPPTELSDEDLDILRKIPWEVKK